MNRPSTPNWQNSLAAAQRGDDTAQLLRSLKTLTQLSAAEQRTLLLAVLAVAERKADYTLLLAVLESKAAAALRADVLAVVLGVADESHPQFADLMAQLRDGERALVLGLLIEASRLDPSAERRLLRLRRLVQVIPQDSRSLYWLEAQQLAEQGGDDAQLTLLGFARELPSSVLTLTLDTLRHSIRKVSSNFKRVMAFISLSELTPLDAADLNEAEVSAARIPDEALRIMTLTRLAKVRSG